MSPPVVNAWAWSNDERVKSFKLPTLLPTVAFPTRVAGTAGARAAPRTAIRSESVCAVQAPVLLCVRKVETLAMLQSAGPPEGGDSSPSPGVVMLSKVVLAPVRSKTIA